MRVICGIDGCKAGWFVVSKELDSGLFSWRVYPTFVEIFQQKPAPLVIAVDIPIGLTERGSRECDQEARRLLGRGRASSVFPAPVRRVLDAASYEEACERRKQVEGRSMSRQSFGIMRKIREVDEVLRKNPSLQETVREAHPEVCFCYMNNKSPMKFGKKKQEGRSERRRLLEREFGKVVAMALAERDKKTCQEDDVLDAFAALWTAERIATGRSIRLPSHPPRDACGLRMEIVA